MSRVFIPKIKGSRPIERRMDSEQYKVSVYQEIFGNLEMIEAIHAVSVFAYGICRNSFGP